MMEENKSLGMQPEETGKAAPVTPHDEEAPMPVWDEGGYRLKNRPKRKASPNRNRYRHLGRL